MAKKMVSSGSAKLQQVLVIAMCVGRTNGGYSCWVNWFNRVIFFGLTRFSEKPAKPAGTGGSSTTP